MKITMALVHVKNKLEFGRDTKGGLKAFAEVSTCRTRSSRRGVERTMVFAVSVKRCPKPFRC